MAEAGHREAGSSGAEAVHSNAVAKYCNAVTEENRGKLGKISPEGEEYDNI